MTLNRRVAIARAEIAMAQGEVRVRAERLLAAIEENWWLIATTMGIDVYTSREDQLALFEEMLRIAREENGA